MAPKSHLRCKPPASQLQNVEGRITTRQQNIAIVFTTPRRRYGGECGKAKKYLLHGPENEGVQISRRVTIAARGKKVVGSSLVVRSTKENDNWDPACMCWGHGDSRCTSVEREVGLRGGRRWFPNTVAMRQRPLVTHVDFLHTLQFWLIFPISIVSNDLHPPKMADLQ